MFKQLFVLFLVAMMFGSSMQQLQQLASRFGGGSGAIPAVPGANLGNAIPGIPGAGGNGIPSIPGAGGPAGANPAGDVAGGAANQGQGLAQSLGFGK